MLSTNISWCDSSVLKSGWSYGKIIDRMNSDKDYYTSLDEVSAIKVGAGSYTFHIGIARSYQQARTSSKRCKSL